MSLNILTNPAMYDHCEIIFEICGDNPSQKCSSINLSHNTYDRLYLAYFFKLLTSKICYEEDQR